MKKILITAAALASISAANASASTVNITNWSVGAHLIGSVSSSTTTHGAIYINQFRYQGVNTTTNSVFDELTNCVDLDHWTANGTYTLASITTRIPDLTKLSQMLVFVGNTTGIVASATGQQKNIDAAAMQLGIWEILYEGGNANYNVTSGTFKSSFAGYASPTDFAAAQARANTWLSSVTNGSWSAIQGKTLGYLQSPTAQSQIFLRDLEQGEHSLIGAVPEPSQWTMLIAGFGLAGFAARRRRQNQFAAVTA